MARSCAKEKGVRRTGSRRRAEEPKWGSDVAQIEGYVEAAFEGVRDAFAANFVEHGEVGAACAVHVDSRKVVDLWGGIAHEASRRPYAEDTLQLVFSTTKGATALCAHRLAERDDLDIDAPVTEYWPE